MRKILHFIWGLPQNLIGLIVYLILWNKSTIVWNYKQSIVMEIPGNLGAISLGMFIFTFTPHVSDRLVRHEYGHSIQSMVLGPLYLLIIGIPSIVWAGCFKNYRKRSKKSYYWFYTESWADRWGGNK